MIPDIPQHKKDEHDELAAARRRFQRNGGKIKKLPALGVKGNASAHWNGRISQELASVARSRNKANKKRNQQALRTEWTELDGK